MKKNKSKVDFQVENDQVIFQKKNTLWQNSIPFASLSFSKKTFEGLKNI